MFEFYNLNPDFLPRLRKSMSDVEIEIYLKKIELAIKELRMEIIAENEPSKRAYTQIEIEDILINLGQAERYSGMFVSGDCTFGIGKDMFFIYSNKRPNKQLLNAFKDASNVSVRHSGKITVGPAK